MLKSSIQIILVIVVPILLIFLILFSPVLLHNYWLNRFANNLYDYPLPPNTVIHSKDKDLGSFLSNGDYCSYMASIKLSSSLSEKQILSYYKDVQLPPAIPSIRSSYIKVEVVFIQKLTNKIIFEIKILDPEYESIGFDLRCC